MTRSGPAAPTPVERLRAHSGEFRKDVVEVVPGVHVAVGFAASNVSMIVGRDGLIVIDTTESTGAARDVLARFRAISALPIAAIVYTHGHRDHISGASVFCAGGSPEIIARGNFESDLHRDPDRPAPTAIMLQRTARQFGMGLRQDTERINLGLGPGDRPTEGLGAGFVAPTRTFDEDCLKLTLCGVDLELHAAPGETADHLVVWDRARRVLFSGDNFYHSFPNLYAIRGTRYRDFDLWADTLDRLIGFGARHLVPGHSRPVSGAEAIRERLGDYRDAIRAIVRQSAAAMNEGLTPDRVVERVRLPEALAEKPHLQEFYGTVAWAARAYFSGTLGWFDGNPSNLFPTPPGARAARLARLAGGADVLMAKARAALDGGDCQWAMELCDLLLDLEAHVEQARAVKADALTAAAERQINATARNYYLVCARELRDGGIREPAP